ncbi:antibiotic biosynthesis monooxygenase [Patulibacter sp. NPDC049589]|uniref:antibiotic biosynthesis monooxygenase family protein n=1 Tax=Patulibacter sp. NPDC049589 TaxID=3154731 RepID=UPI003421DDC2
MAVVKINAIEVDPERGPELEQRFAQRASEVETMPGFLSFELLRPTAGETRYFVYTRWESEEDFQAWVKSAAFTRGHAQASSDRGAEKPVAHGSSVLGFDVVLSVEKARSEA